MSKLPGRRSRDRAWRRTVLHRVWFGYFTVRLTLAVRDHNNRVGVENKTSASWSAQPGTVCLGRFCSPASRHVGSTAPLRWSAGMHAHRTNHSISREQICPAKLASSSSHPLLPCPWPLSQLRRLRPPPLERCPRVRHPRRSFLPGEQDQDGDQWQSASPWAVWSGASETIRQRMQAVRKESRIADLASPDSAFLAPGMPPHRRTYRQAGPVCVVSSTGGMPCHN